MDRTVPLRPWSTGLGEGCGTGDKHTDNSGGETQRVPGVPVVLSWLRMAVEVGVVEVPLCPSCDVVFWPAGIE